MCGLYVTGVISHIILIYGYYNTIMIIHDYTWENKNQGQKKLVVYKFLISARGNCCIHRIFHHCSSWISYLGHLIHLIWFCNDMGFF